MSHQSGISVSDALARSFAAAVAAPQCRCIKVSIVDESLQESGYLEAGGSWQEDYDQLAELLEPAKPCYLLFKLEHKAGMSDSKWILLSYVPDNAQVRDKMLYAATRATLTRELGDSRFIDSIHGTTKEEFTYAGYKAYLDHKGADHPLTVVEEELHRVKREEASEQKPLSARRAHASGVSLPINDDVAYALEDLSQSHIDTVVMQLNDAAGEIVLAKSGRVGADGLGSYLSSSAPQFVVFAYPYDGSVEHLFIYLCPTSSTIRQRMVYSSAKASVLAQVQEFVGLRRNVELDNLRELDAAYIHNELFPPPTHASGGTNPPAFRKPAPPRGRARFAPR